MAKRLLVSPRALVERDQVSFFDDFTWYVTAHNFTTVATDSGTVSVGDAANGIVALVASDGTVADNDESYIKSTNELFKFAAGRVIFGEAKIQFTEANTDDANVFFGFADAIGANTLVDDGAGMKTSFSGAAIYKVDGGTVWKCVSSNGSSQTITTSTATAGGASYQTLSIEMADVDGTSMEVTFFVDGRPLLDSTYRKPIKHTVAITSGTEMQVGAGVKNGFTNLETLNVDYIFAAQSRQ
jgi:hypothetical protein